MTETTLVSEVQVRDAISMPEVLEIVEKNFIADGRDELINPSKLRMDLGEDGGWPNHNAIFVTMPTYVDWVPATGVKIINGFWDNVGTDYPTMSAIIVLVDMEYGTFDAILEGSHITGLRTGAQTAIGAKYLAASDASTVSVYGAGTQGRNQALAMDEIMDVEQFTIYDEIPEATEAYLDEMAPQLSGDLVAVDDPEDAADSDVLVTVTTADEPFVEPEWIEPGTLVAALGSYQEVADGVITGADKIVVDHVEQSLHAGNLKPLVDRDEIGAENIYGTLGDITNGTTAGREDDDEVILYVPFGLAAHDVAVAAAVQDTVEGDTSTFSF